MTYLILHKVRGEPAFDVADKLQIGDEEGWIIPTSGHRAYPWQSWPMHDTILQVVEPKYDIPDDWPDHYNIDKGEAPKPDFNIMSIISNLSPKFLRRL